MKKTYENPVAEKIEFDYAEACYPSGNGGNSGNSGNSGIAKQTYMQGNENYECHSSLMPDEPCGIALSGGRHTSNANYDC